MSSPSPPAADPVSTRARQRQSCLACRAIKVRCNNNGDYSCVCPRCKRLDIPCEYSSRRRGRKTNVERVLRNLATGHRQDSQSPKTFSATRDSAATDKIGGLSNVTEASTPTILADVGKSAQPSQTPTLLPIGPSQSLQLSSLTPSQEQPTLHSNLTPLQLYPPQLQQHSATQLDSQTTQTTIRHLTSKAPASLMQPTTSLSSSLYGSTLPHISSLPSSTTLSFTNQRSVHSMTDASQPSDSLLTHPDIGPISEMPSTVPSTSTSTSTRTMPTVPRLDVSEYLDPPLPPPSLSASAFSAPHNSFTSPERSSRPSDNPEASHLVNMFHWHLNPIVALLDPHLHTLDYMSESSSELLTAVLAASAKFFRPDIHPQLLDHAQALLSRAISAGTCGIGIIQCLMILVCWKAPSDRSAYIKVGIAIRLGYQHGWYMVNDRILPTDEREAREILNEERTWLCLACFDRNLPTMIRPHEIRQPEAWAREHAHLDTPVDLHLAISLEMTTIYEQFERVAKTPKLSRPFWTVFLAGIEAEYEQKVQKWFSSDRALKDLTEQSRLLIKLIMLDASLTIKKRALEWNVGFDGGVSECLAAISSIVDHVDVLAKAGLLVYLHDVTSILLSETTLLIYKLFWRLSSNQKTLAIGYIKQIHATCTSVSNGTDSQAIAFIARFTSRTLRSLSLESRAPSRASPTDEGDGRPDMMNQEFLTDLDDFLASVNMQPEMTPEDAQYWMSLFVPTGDGGTGRHNDVQF